VKTVGSFEAKTHLAALLDLAASGETIIITRHGRPVARLSPVLGDAERPNVEETIAELIEFRNSHRLEGLSVKDLVEEGRKY
jgi:prevent-host-death family protein